MVIKHRKKYFWIDLILGTLYLGLGLSSFFFDSNSILGKYGFTLVGIIYLVQFFYKWKNPYLKFEKTFLVLNIIFQQKKIDLSQVTRIKKFTDEITFLTPHEKLKISTKLISREDLPAFEEAIASLNLDPERNPFKKITQPV